MKLEILLIALLCTVKATGKVNADLKIEEGGSGTENDTLINSIEKIDAGLKKQVDDTDSSIGSGDDDDDSDEGSGSGDDFSGSGEGLTGRKTNTTISPTFNIGTDRENMTSHTVVVINYGITGAAPTTKKSPTVNKGVKEITPQINDFIDNNVEPTQNIDLPKDDNVIKGKATGEEKNESTGGVNFTIAIIVGVVAGAILSILIIVFLVYRLRKKDEGSYSLDEPSSAMLTADADSPPPKGKGEYFA